VLKQAIQIAAVLAAAALLGGCANPDLTWWMLSHDHAKAIRIDQIRSEAEQHLDRGDPLKAVQLIVNNGFPPARLSQTYRTAFNRLLDQAQASYEVGDFVAAGEIWHQALVYYPGDKTLQADITVDAVQLGQRLDRCADQLLEAGLAAYRNGRLQDAIDVWSQIRHFHPGYKASRQAIQTTRKQLKNLELLNNPG